MALGSSSINVAATYTEGEVTKSATSTVPVTVIDCSTCIAPNAVAGVDQNLEICPRTVPPEVSFSGSISGAYTSYAWNFDDGNVEITNTLSPIHVFPAGAHTYNVTLSVIGDCGSASDSVSITITEYDGPEAIIGDPNPGEICPGESDVTVSFDGSSSTGNIVTYNWDFGDGTIVPDDVSTPSHDYTTEGTYSVTLTVTDTNGCTDTATTSVEITQCVNTAPVINYIPDKTVCKYSTFTYTVTVDPTTIDPEEILTYKLLHAPPTMNIDEKTGIITWTANCSGDDQSVDRCFDCLCCRRNVTVKVKDDGCCGAKSDTEKFTICVKWCCCH